MSRDLLHIAVQLSGRTIHVPSHPRGHHSSPRYMLGKCTGNVALDSGLTAINTSVSSEGILFTHSRTVRFYYKAGYCLDTAEISIRTPLDAVDGFALAIHPRTHSAKTLTTVSVGVAVLGLGGGRSRNLRRLVRLGRLRSRRRGRARGGGGGLVVVVLVPLDVADALVASANDLERVDVCICQVCCS